MEARELRIGNWVYNLYIKKEMEVYPMLIPQLSKVKDNNINPIPLTEEWLLRLGFIKHITKDIYPTYTFGKIQVNDGVVFVSEIGFLNHIKHVHQLQNLYFALTNKELKIK